MLALAAALALWIAADFALPGSYSLRHFDGHDVGRLETAMWRSYYEHHPLRLFGQLTELLRRQYHLPFWRAALGAYHAARAAVVFQRGSNRAEYERALPDLVRFYGGIRRVSAEPFAVDRTAWLELEWWIVHRERAQHGAGDLERSLAALQAEVYQRPVSRFAGHARARAEAMRLRDARAAAGGMSAADWTRIGGLLDESWVALQQVVGR